MATARVSLQFEDGGYVDLGGDLATFKPSLEATLAEEVVYGRTFPHYTMTGLTGSLDIGGLRTSPTGLAYYKEYVNPKEQRAFFCVIHKNAMVLGPCGYVTIKNSDILDKDGVFKVEGGAVASPGDDFETWRYGTVLPRTMNKWVNQGEDGFPAPVANMVALIDVVDPGDLTALSIQLNKASDTYSFAAAVDSGKVARGISTGALVTGGASPAGVPGDDLTGFRWQIVSGGAGSSATFYACVLHLFD